MAKQLKPCESFSFHKSGFARHLQCHEVCDLNSVNTRAERCLFGKSLGFRAFWCGFCNAFLSIPLGSPKPWDKRFDHIGDHFSKEGKRIESWGPSPSGQDVTIDHLQLLPKSATMSYSTPTGIHET